MSKNDQLKTIWSAYKNGMHKVRLAELMDCSVEKVIELLEEAQKKFGKGPKKEIAKEKPVTPGPAQPLFKPQAWTRPKARYTNPSHDEMIERIMQTQL